MSADRRYFVDIFSDIVDAVREEYDPTNDLQPYYIYGHPREIANKLSLKDRSKEDKFKKFPLVALLTDFTEGHGESLADDYNLSVRCIIVTNTNKNYVSDERYENTFKPILYPIYELLLKKVALSPALKTVSQGLIAHEKTDRLYWGAAGIYGNDGLIFNENLDAIDVNFTDLTVLADVYRSCQ